MKTNLAYASNCSDSVYSYIYQALQQRSGAENESLYQQAISSCRTAKQKKKLAGYYAGPWQLLFNAWCNNRVPNIAVLALLLQQCLSHFQCEEVIAAWQ
ncbi:hypothetical protein GL381_06125 [Salmonella enterica]|uniref:Uncharacterized protein n=2 Tax=Salmonella enterica I TaxID=59201 RepID=A0A5X0G811_SALET|nr:MULTISPECIES: hypothetical protein [Enterobacteriaceae]EAW1302427.1 hypothetical protein [Salmonella enterica subsp. enterica]EBB7794502.1 hypothetical protein [Salmonella enterica subsp. enterica serovar Montevideo]EBD4525720.1 hypothetical protein [Salmonella enterica subsp. enterica serovar Ohio]EBH9679796.1 hypothetical protein [Salmonella enterica subsp. enterica serovar 4,[5],12:i:-]EBH9986447.1 hypothetical protein [Salmonella enterica subsp. enterica serovar Amager]EBS5434204.1 hyp